MKKTILLTLALTAFGAQAAGDGIYAGLNHNHFKLSSDDVSGSLNAVGVYGGYRMGNFAGEVSRFQKTDEGVKTVLTDFSLIPRLAVAKDVDVLAKLGLRHSEMSEGNDKLTGTSLVVGAGVEYTLMPQLSTRVMVDHTSKTFGKSIKTTTTTIGLAYRF